MSGMHGGETDAQRQDMLTTARRLTKDFCLRPRPRSASAVRVLLFHIPVLDCTQWAKSTFTDAMEKCKQLTVHRLLILMQITACPQVMLTINR